VNVSTVSLIEGDGIGPEITAATLRAVEACGGQLAWERVDAGAGAVARHGDPLPAATLASIQRNQLALKAPLATPSGGGYRSVNVTLRQHFDLYANGKIREGVLSEALIDPGDACVWNGQ